MYFLDSPLLTKGSFATFFGGPGLLSQLSSKPRQLTPVHPLAMSLSCLCQILFIIFKKIHFSDYKPTWVHTRRTTYTYQNLLKNTILTGFNNTYSMIWILVFTISIGAWMTMHYVSILVNTTLDPSEQEIILPGNIVGFACLLMGLNVLQFLKNPALG